jgi:hypothetical protein
MRRAGAFQFHHYQPTTPGIQRVAQWTGGSTQDEEKQYAWTDNATQVRRRRHGDRGYACAQKVGDGD